MAPTKKHPGGKPKPKKAAGPPKKHHEGSARPALKKKSKMVVSFDAEKRKEFLTGFSKRKQERRRFGLDMEAYKQKKRQLEQRKQRREEQKQMLSELDIQDDDSDADKPRNKSKSGDDSDDDAADGPVTEVLQFDDEHTQGKFGDVVTVTTSVGGLQSDSEDNLSDLEDLEDDEENAAALESAHAKGKGRHHKPQEQHLTLFQRIQQKRRGLALPSKRAKLREARANRNSASKKGKSKGAGRNVNGKRGASSKDDGGDSKSVAKKQGANKRRKKH
ncbi:TPA: hypothetical protein N0F65_005016 [Lagenidium giganteum]|uniref:Nucleolar protein 12 n=1 Tax=Lagenidium giganteum TaxID=4803 RepID=A0AAV2ZGK0_9STRA|nr:TPA: hypothetical protein N0F65_005016 [Lagenidium giganteum]